MTTQFPARDRRMRSMPLRLGEGQALDDLRLSLFRGGVIAGRIVDQYGEPLENAQVNVLPYVPRGSNRASATRRTGMTYAQPGRSNDLGEFRVVRVDPGSYILVVTPTRSQSSEDLAAPARTFYPGVQSIDEAQPITIERGQSALGLDFTVSEGALTTISGTVVGAGVERATGAGPMSRGYVSVVERNTGTRMNWNDMSTSVRPDGTFELKLQPGDYVLQARRVGNPAAPGDTSEDERGSLPIVVSGEAMAGLVIPIGTSATVRGRVSFDGTKPPPTDLRSAWIWFQPHGDEPSTCQSTERMPRGNIKSDGTFEATGIWGTCSASVNPPTGWQVKSVMYRGTDVWRKPVAFPPGSVASDFQIVFTDRVGEIVFDVEDDRGAPSNAYVAFVFSIDKQYWGEFPYTRTHVASPEIDAQRAMRLAGADSTPVDPGTGMPAHKIGVLLPGDYFVAAVDDVTYEDARDPEFLAQLAPLATRVTLGEGESKTVRLRRLTLPAAAR